MPPRRLAGAGVWITAAAVFVFAAFALSFLYFFVDDEAIPLVYAQNIDEGRGLTYNTVEGRVEGYSDFLQVIADAVLIRFTRLLGLSKLAPLEAGKGLSFLFGIAVVLTTARALRRARASPAGLTAGLAFLALAGPLALWSCSSLEAVAFALVVIALAFALFDEPGDAQHRRTSVLWLASIAMLMRIDGFVHVTALLLAAIATADRDRRRQLATRVVLPIVLIAVGYHAARLVFFGSLLPAPLEAKVLYKLAPHHGIVVKGPDRSYLAGFMDLYGVALVPALAFAALTAWSRPLARQMVIAAACMLAYVALVGDWMFGWRFLVPVVPLAAIVIGTSVSRVRGAAAWAVAVLIVVWSASAARVFARDYTTLEARPNWWTDRSAGTRVWLQPYGDLLTLARGALHGRRETFAFNQAGLLPYLLDVDNIDDLGICSRFVAELPTSDIYFTEVGRYSPLTDAPVLRAAHAYLLYRDVRVIASRTDLLMHANGGRVPGEILNGFFRLYGIDPPGANAVYVRSSKPADRYRSDPDAFQENLAHTSRLRHVEIDGNPVAESAAALAFLREGNAMLPVRRRLYLRIPFAERDEQVDALYVAAISSRDPVTATFTLYDASSRRVGEATSDVSSRTHGILQPFDHVRARLLTVEIESSISQESQVTIGDLRLQGQSAALRDYVSRRLPFPHAAASQ